MITISHIARYLASGGIGITVNLSAYYLLVRAGMPYIAGSICALALSTIVGFLLQKFWTFEDRRTDVASRQLLFYSVIALANIAINTGIVFVLIHLLHVWYLLAQAVGAGVVAVSSYFLYRTFLFNSKEDPPIPAE